jgi:hypothetical protein
MRRDCCACIGRGPSCPTRRTNEARCNDAGNGIAEVYKFPDVYYFKDSSRCAR